MTDELGVQLFTGRLPKDPTYCSALPQFGDFATLFPEPEKKWSNTEMVGIKVGKSIGELYPIDGNDREGNCTCAGALHAGTLLAGLTGQVIIPTAQNALDLYHSLGGRGMSGLMLKTVLQRWYQGFYGLEPILGAINIDPSNHKSIRQAIQFLGGLYIGFATTGRTVSDFQGGGIWTTDARQDGGGHCVWVSSYDDYLGHTKSLTWGGEATADQKWWDRDVDEAYAVVTKSSSIFTKDAIDDLIARMKSLGN